MRTVTDTERRDRIAVRHALAVEVTGPETAAQAVTCLHATDPASVYLSAFARSGASRADIADALFGRRGIVRQLAMRRTVFAFPREVFPAVRGSASARVAAQQATRLANDLERAGIAADGAEWVARVCAETRAAIRERPDTASRLRTRVKELDTRLATEGRYGADTPIATRLLTVLAADGSIVRGANDGGWKVSRPVWTSVEDWLGADPGLLGERAGYRELVGRWLWSFGPGTEDDIVWWLGATKAAVRRALDDLDATPVRLADDTPAWLHPEDTELVGFDRDWAALVPALDPSTMGWRHRDFYLGPHAAKIFDRNGNGGATAWWNGRIVGTWTQGDDATVTVIPAEPLPRKATTALAERAEALTRWLDGDIVRSVYRSPLLQPVR